MARSPLAVFLRPGEFRSNSSLTHYTVAPIFDSWHYLAQPIAPDLRDHFRIGSGLGWGFGFLAAQSAANGTHIDLGGSSSGVGRACSGSWPTRFAFRPRASVDQLWLAQCQ